MTKRFVVPGVSCILWGLILYLGITLYMGVVDQRVPGYPNQGQMRTFIILPAALLVANAASFMFIRRIPRALLLLAFPVQIIFALYLVMLAEGGV